MDATQWAGVLSFGVASAACLVTACRPWPLLAIVNGCYAAECALGSRHGLHNAAIAAMGEYYSGRASIQMVLIAIALGLGAIFILPRRTDPAGRTRSGAATATLVTALLFILETISLHRVDAVLYRPAAAGLLVIGWLWLLLGGATIIGALREVRRTGVKSR